MALPGASVVADASAGVSVERAAEGGPAMKATEAESGGGAAGPATNVTEEVNVRSTPAAGRRMVAVTGLVSALVVLTATAKTPSASVAPEAVGGVVKLPPTAMPMPSKLRSGLPSASLT